MDILFFEYANKNLHIAIKKNENKFDELRKNNTRFLIYLECFNKAHVIYILR